LIKKRTKSTKNSEETKTPRDVDSLMDSPQTVGDDELEGLSDESHKNIENTDNDDDEGKFS
jgi:hypothetical protein